MFDTCRFQDATHHIFFDDTRGAKTEKKIPAPTMDYKTLPDAGPDAHDMNRNHLLPPQVRAEAVAVTINSEAKIMSADDYVAPPKPEDAKCRLCGSMEGQNLLIKPCRCDGGNKYVHRDCLDQQRSFNENNQGFMHCRDCEYRYWIDVKDSYAPDKRCCGEPKRIWKFRGLVARDTIAIFVLLQMVIIGFAYVVERADSCASLQGCGQGCGDVKPFGYVCGSGVTTYDPTTGRNETVIYGGELLNDFSFMHVNEHYKTTYYFIGLLFFFAALGCVGCMHSCCWFCEDGNKEKGVDGYTQSCVDDYTCMYCFYADRSCCCYGSRYRHHSYHYQPVGSTYYGGGGNNNCDCCNGCNCCDGCNCNGCNCNGDCKCDGGGGGDGAAVLLVIAVIVFVILVLVGFIYGLILLTLVMTKMVQKHYALAQRRVMTRNYIVRDLDGIFIPPVERMYYGDRTQIVHHANLPTAPPIDEVELRAFGLL